jgi:hypothetical protein
MKILNSSETIEQSCKDAGFEKIGIAFDKYKKKYSVWEKDGVTYHFQGLDIESNTISFKDITGVRLTY